MTFTSPGTQTAATDPSGSEPHTNSEADATSDAAPDRGTKKAKLAAGLLTLGLLAGGGYALTQTGSSSAATPGASNSQGGPGAGGGGAQGGPGGAGAPVSGSISAITTTSISVKTATGTTATYQITSATTVANNGATSTAAKLTIGEKVVVFTGARPGATTTSGSTDTASRILAGSSATQRPGTGAGTGGGAPPSTT